MRKRNGSSLQSGHNSETWWLQGKVVLITGGASGIGKETAKVFAQHGARLIIADIQDKAGAAVCEELNAQTKATYLHCDVTHEPDVERAVDAAVDRYGKLDIMFNNAGIMGSPVRQILQSDKSNFEKVMSVNVTGCYLGTKHAARSTCDGTCKAGQHHINRKCIIGGTWHNANCIHMFKACCVKNNEKCSS